MSKLGAKENLILDDPASNDMVSGWGESSTLIAKMEEWQKKPPMAPADPPPAAGCMDKYKSYYNGVKGGGTPDMPKGTTAACDDCLRQRASWSRPWSDAEKYCADRCCP